MNHRIAIIVAGGKGQRMQQAVPKQFLLLDEIPVLMRTIHAFHATEPRPLIVVVLARDVHDYWLDLCHKYQFHAPHYLAEGGDTRFQSVKSGLKFLEENGLLPQDTRDCLIAVHDGARPLIRTALINQGYESASNCAAVTLALPSTDSLRMVDPLTGTNLSLQRDQVYQVQTPQTFTASILIDAYTLDERSDFTDDATIVAEKGHPITLIEGDPRNIKITYESDLALAIAYLRTS